MVVSRGYRIVLDGAGSLGDLVSSLRSGSMRTFSRRYGIVLADELARRIDMNRAGLAGAEAGASPIRESLEVVRAAFDAPGRRTGALSLDLKVRIHLVEGSALLEVEDGHDDYLRVVADLPGVKGFSLPTSGRGEVPAREWAERERLWELAKSGPPLGSGLVFRMVEGQLPSLRFAAVKRHFPSFESRVRRTARAAVYRAQFGGVAPADQEAVKEFRRHLETAAGKVAFERESRRLGRILPRSIEKEDATSFGKVAKGGEPRVATVSAKEQETPAQIDHADVLESADGRIFVAVMDAGLAPDERLHIQVVDRHLAFVQGGVHYGSVSNAPHAAVDLLRESREAIVVELRRGSGRKEIKARHVALVRDDGRPDVLAAAMANFRNAAERTRRKAASGWLKE